MKKLDEFLFIFLMLLFVSGSAGGWPLWHKLAMGACILFVLARNAWPPIKRYLDEKKNRDQQDQRDQYQEQDPPKA